MNQGLSPSTVRKAHELLARRLADAVKNGLIATTPCRDIELPRVGQAEQRHLTVDEIGRLSDAMPNW